MTVEECKLLGNGGIPCIAGFVQIIESIEKNLLDSDKKVLISQDKMVFFQIL